MDVNISCKKQILTECYTGYNSFARGLMNISHCLFSIDFLHAADVFMTKMLNYNPRINVSLYKREILDYEN